MQLILLKSSGASTAVLSKHGTVWWHWCILQPTLPYLRVLQHSRGVSSCTHQHKEGGWRGNVSLVNLPVFLALFVCQYSQASVLFGGVPPFPSIYMQEGFSSDSWDVEVVTTCREESAGPAMSLLAALQHLRAAERCLPRRTPRLWMK